MLDLWGKNTGEDGKGERERWKERGGQESEDGGAGRKHSLARARAAPRRAVGGVASCASAYACHWSVVHPPAGATYWLDCCNSTLYRARTAASAVACVGVRTAARVTSSLVNVTVHPGSEVNYVKTDVLQVH